MSMGRFTVRPGYRKGGKGRFTRISSPCEFEFQPKPYPPRLQAQYSPTSNIWLAILATIITQIVVVTIAQVTGFMVGPGLIIWYLIINSIRRREEDIDLNRVNRIVADFHRREISILGNITGKHTWIGVKCREHFDAIVEQLKNLGQVTVEHGKLRSSQRGMLVLLIVLLTLLVFIIFIIATLP